MHNLKIAVIGCGHWGKNLVRNFADLKVLEYVFDPNTKSQNEISKKFKVKFDSLDNILKSNIDGVAIAAPAAKHFDLTKKFLNASKHVFVEKPISLNTTEAQELCDLSKKKKKVLMVGHLLQYHSAFLKLKDMVIEGALGKLQYIYSNRLNLGKFRNEENILWSFAPHDISMILSLIGMNPKSTFATGSAYLNKNIHDVTTTHLKFEKDIQAHIFVSWLHPYKEQKLVIVGDSGMAVFDDGLDWSMKLKLYPHKVNWKNGLPEAEKAEYEKVPLDQKEPLREECMHFLDCIKNSSEPRTNANEGLNVLKVLEASHKSLVTGEEVMIENKKKFFAHGTSCIDNEESIGKNTKIWHYSHILKDTKIGANCIIGQNVMIGPDVVVGNGCKIQNNVSIYKGVTLQDNVFCGPSCVFTNVINPRANIERKNEFRNTLVENCVTIGANATIICGNRLGAYSMIGAGAVVTKSVKPHAVVVGNPAKQVGWVSHAGEKLDKSLTCPLEGRQYSVDKKGNLKEIKKYGVVIKKTA